jgi:hypothetical protein
MKKIPTLLVRKPNDRAHVLDEVNPGCEWVLAGEGVATRKYDGTCVKKDETGMWWARREVKKGKTPPESFVFDNFDEVTGKTQGWVLIDFSPFYEFWLEAVKNAQGFRFASGTYELCGPKINGNPEGVDEHFLTRHGVTKYDWLKYPMTIAEVKGLVEVSRDAGIEGVVWHHPDGRMAKLKGKDLV